MFELDYLLAVVVPGPVGRRTTPWIAGERARVEIDGEL